MSNNPAGAERVGAVIALPVKADYQHGSVVLRTASGRAINIHKAAGTIALALNTHDDVVDYLDLMIQEYDHLTREFVSHPSCVKEAKAALSAARGGR